MTALNIRDFGATGRGLENDTVAFQQAATELNAADGGTLFIPHGEYQVGLQDLAGACGLGYAWRPQPILQLVGCSSPVLIEGEGEYETVLKAAPGLRFGAFVLHRWSEPEPDNPSVSFRSLVRGTGLEQVIFQEDLRLPASADPNKEPPWYIDLGTVIETRDVFATGPYVRWGGLGGPVGAV
jgi:Pectate lyase superfamily protein